MESNQEVVDILKKTGAVINDSHFVYISGKHAPTYINKDYIFPHITYISRIAEIIAEKFKNTPIDVVAGPSMGGIILFQWTAYHLGILKGKNVLVVEDIVTTGGSVKKVIDSVLSEGGKVIAACAIVNKDPLNINPEFIGVPFDYLTILGMDVWDEKDCPLCKSGVPINTEIGHGKKFLEEKKNKRR